MSSRHPEPTDDEPTGSTSFEEKLRQHGVHLENGDQLCWNDNADGHPRHWGARAKTFSILVICWLELFMTGISSAGVGRRPPPLSPPTNPNNWLQGADVHQLGVNV